MQTRNGNRVEIVSVNESAQTFTAPNWRDGIIYFLQTSWDGRMEGNGFDFNGMSTGIVMIDGKYWAFTKLRPNPDEITREQWETLCALPEDGRSILADGSKPGEVRDALMRFVRNNEIRQLCFYAPVCQQRHGQRLAYVFFSKGVERDELYVGSYNVLHSVHLGQ